MGYRWKPSKSKAKEFALLMNEIDEFCAKNGINNSSTNDSYYFRINGKKISRFESFSREVKCNCV